jgi:cytochrome c6
MRLRRTDLSERVGRRLAARWLFFGLAAAALAALVVPIGLAGRSGSSGAELITVNVKARDKGFALSATSVPVGTVRFVVKNLGKRKHNFRIAGKKTPVLKPGKTARLLVVFKKPGAYAYASTLAGDARNGLRGRFALEAPPKSEPGGNAKLGRAVFLANGCSACHTLKAAGASGTIGTNLDRAKPSYATIVGVVTNGKTGKLGTMPAFKGSLTGTQIENVAAFIHDSTS